MLELDVKRDSRLGMRYLRGVGGVVRRGRWNRVHRPQPPGRGRGRRRKSSRSAAAARRRGSWAPDLFDGRLTYDGADALLRRGALGAKRVVDVDATGLARY